MLVPSGAAAETRESGAVMATQICFVFTSTIGKDFQFDEHIFQMG